MFTTKRFQLHNLCYFSFSTHLFSFYFIFPPLFAWVLSLLYFLVSCNPGHCLFTCEISACSTFLAMFATRIYQNSFFSCFASTFLSTCPVFSLSLSLPGFCFYLMPCVSCFQRQSCSLIWKEPFRVRLMLHILRPVSICWMCWIRTTSCWSIFRPWGDTCCWARETSSDTSWTSSSKCVCVCVFTSDHSLKHRRLCFSLMSVCLILLLIYYRSHSFLGVINLSLSLALSQARVGEGCHHTLPTQSNRYPGDCRQSNQCPVWQSGNTEEAWCPATGGT